MNSKRFIFFVIAILTGWITPAHALSDHPVISEILIDTAGLDDHWEFVEIYNPTGDTVDIGGWDIAFKSTSASSFSAVATIPSGRFIAPFGYFLVGGDSLNPLPDYIALPLAFNNTAGGIALRKMSTNLIVDKVGYGTGSDSEGSAAPKPPINQSLERKPGAASPTKGNGQDQDNNLNDFSIRTSIQPQNAASGPEYPDSNPATLTVSPPAVRSLNDTVDVAVVDVDRNNKTTVAESITIRVTSQADPVGISLALKEISTSSPTFTLFATGGTLTCTTTQSSSAAKRLIQVRSIDTITVTYQDPAPFDLKTETINVQLSTQPPTAEAEKHEILTLLAYSIAYIDSQSDAQKGRGYNIAAVLLNKDDKNDSILFWGRNCVNQETDFSSHAEVNTMEGYVRSAQRDTLAGLRLYTTLEPCAMCAGMATLGPISLVVYGQTDSGSGGVLQLLDSAGRNRPTPLPSPTVFRTRLETAYQQSGQHEITTWLYSSTARSIFGDAYNTFVNYINFYHSNDTILIQAQKYLQDVQADTTTRRKCRTSGYCKK